MENIHVITFITFEKLLLLNFLKGFPLKAGSLISDLFINIYKIVNCIQKRISLPRPLLLMDGWYRHQLN